MVGGGRAIDCEAVEDAVSVEGVDTFELFDSWPLLLLLLLVFDLLMSPLRTIFGGPGFFSTSFESSKSLLTNG